MNEHDTMLIPSSLVLGGCYSPHGVVLLKPFQHRTLGWLRISVDLCPLPPLPLYEVETICFLSGRCLQQGWCSHLVNKHEMPWQHRGGGHVMLEPHFLCWLCSATSCHLVSLGRTVQMSEYLSLRLHKLYCICCIVLMEKVLHHPECMKPSKTSQSNSTTPGNHHPDQCKISPINIVQCGEVLFLFVMLFLACHWGLLIFGLCSGHLVQKGASSVCKSYGEWMQMVRSKKYCLFVFLHWSF